MVNRNERTQGGPKRTETKNHHVWGLKVKHRSEDNDQLRRNIKSSTELSKAHFQKNGKGNWGMDHEVFGGEAHIGKEWKQGDITKRPLENKDKKKTPEKRREWGNNDVNGDSWMWEGGSMKNGKGGWVFQKNGWDTKGNIFWEGW